jgi:hypothetical protein
LLYWYKSTNTDAEDAAAMRCLYMYTTVGEMAVLIFYARQYWAVALAAAVAAAAAVFAL